MLLTPGIVLSAIDRAASHLPDLRIVVVPDTRGHDWITARSVIYLRDGLPPVEWARHLLDALDDLCRCHRVPNPRGLFLVPAPRDDTEQAVRTGTGGP